MREINLDTWERRTHFLTYRDFEQPLFGMCANVDVGQLYEHAKRLQCSFTVAVIYIISKAANAIPQLRQRIRGTTVIEHEVVHPSTTVLLANDLFTFCTMDYVEPFSAFAAGADERVAHAKQNPSLQDEPGRDDMLYMTPIPWVTFTSFMHPYPARPVDSVPRLAWGKRVATGSGWQMPLAVQGHHALMDGVHMGRFYGELADYFQRPKAILTG